MNVNGIHACIKLIAQVVLFCFLLTKLPGKDKLERATEVFEMNVPEIMVLFNSAPKISQILA